MNRYPIYTDEMILQAYKLLKALDQLKLSGSVSDAVTVNNITYSLNTLAHRTVKATGERERGKR